jgi:hypothetical protein
LILHMKTRYFIFILLLLLSTLNSCFFVKVADNEEPPQTYTYTPKPEIDMSEEQVRSRAGDFIAFLPKDWFFIDHEEKASSDIFAIASNPDYTLSAVFANIRDTEIPKELITKEGLYGLARTCFDKKMKKTAGNIKQVGKYTLIESGNHSFVVYEFTNNTGNVSTLSAVFISSLDKYYEFSIVPMEFTGRQIPTKNDIKKIFNSILATIQY